MWKIAICGLGAAARQIHLPAYAGLNNVSVVGGFDPGIDKADFPFPLYSSFEDMIDKAQPDIVAIVTPTASHFELSRQALDAGCHVFCEKPFMSNMQEAQDIVKRAAEVGKQIVVNNQYRFMNIHEAAKNRIGTDEFGELLFMSANQTFFVSDKTEDGWRGNDPQRTCKEFGIHVLDLARYFFDEDPVSIQARMPKPGRPDSPDYLDLITLEFSGDRVAHILLDRLSRGPHRYLDIRLDGSEAIVETSFGGKIECHAGIKGGSRKPYLELDLSMGGRARLYHGDKYRKLASDPLDVFANATRKLMAQYIAALENNSTPPCNGADNMRTLALVYAAYESSEKRQPVSFDA